MRTRLKIAIFCACTMAILVVAAVGGAAWYFASQLSQHGSAEELEREFALVRDRGEPVSPDELSEFCGLDPSEANVAPLIMEATSDLISPDFMQDAEGLVFVGLNAPEPIWPGQNWEQKLAAQALLAKYAAQLKQLHAAAGMRGIALHPIDFRQGTSASLAHLDGWRPGARLLSLEALVAAHEDRPADAARAIRAIYALSHSLQREPTLVSQLTRFSLQSIAHHLLNELLPRSEFSSDDLRGLQSDLRAADLHAAFKQALIGERVQNLVVFADPTAFAEGADRAPDCDAPIQRSVDALMFMQSMDGLIAAAERPWPDARRHYRDTDQQIRAMSKRFPEKLRFTLTLLLLPSFESTVVIFARNDATRLLLDVAIAAELFRRDQGDFPEDLRQLTPAYLPSLPLDPFNGQPLRYRKSDDAVIIYSVGENELDDEGKGDLVGKPDLQVTLPAKTPRS